MTDKSNETPISDNTTKKTNCNMRRILYGADCMGRIWGAPKFWLLKCLFWGETKLHQARHQKVIWVIQMKAVGCNESKSCGLP